MAQEVSCRLLTEETWAWSQARPCGICGGQSGIRKGFLPSTSGFPCRCNFTNASHWSSSICCFYRKDKRVKPGNLPKDKAVSEIMELWRKNKYFHLFPIFNLHLLYKLSKDNSVNTLSSERLWDYTVYNLWYSFQSNFPGKFRPTITPNLKNLSHLQCYFPTH